MAGLLTLDVKQRIVMMPVPVLCLAVNGVHVCVREAGHPGAHQAKNADGTTFSW